MQLRVVLSSLTLCGTEPLCARLQRHQEESSALQGELHHTRQLLSRR